MRMIVCSALAGILMAAAAPNGANAFPLAGPTSGDPEITLAAGGCEIRGEVAPPTRGDHAPTLTDGIVDGCGPRLGVPGESAAKEGSAANERSTKHARKGPSGSFRDQICNVSGSCPLGSL